MLVTGTYNFVNRIFTVKARGASEIAALAVAFP
jgi:hypothetical protein